ncbi:hypothetical protein Rhopal_005085-T1 [Rhodotorula paludigena]|uniref:Uncharacterized protein n=1 Tax=Rhodotorula paludigena TaxID=86838 RepID=A0AAV5GRG1_9BASI|nr:hypothetical protein Rhopal_005085-T1 [Rhodotorula paludigena]
MPPSLRDRFDVSEAEADHLEAALQTVDEFLPDGLDDSEVVLKKARLERDGSLRQARITRDAGGFTTTLSYDRCAAVFGPALKRPRTPTDEVDQPALVDDPVAPGHAAPSGTNSNSAPRNDAVPPLDAALGALVLYAGPRSTPASAPSTPHRAVRPLRPLRPLRTSMTSPRAASTTKPAAAFGAPVPLRFGEPTVEEPDEVVTASSLFPHLYGPRAPPFRATPSPSPPKKARFGFEGAASRSPFASWAPSSSSTMPATSGMYGAVPSNFGASTSSTTLDGDSTLMVEELF